MAEWPTVHNPFSTSFGSQPPVLVGRDEELALIRTGLGSGPGAKHFGTVLVGRRGYGKTVLLGKMREEASEREWPVIQVNCSTGTALQEIEERGRNILAHRYSSITDRIAARVKGGGVSVLGTGAHIDIDLSKGKAASLTDLLIALGEGAKENEQGVLLLADEMHNFETRDMRVLAATLQLVTNDLGYPIAYIGAGLPRLEDDIISDEAISFFHRCDRLTLGAIDDSEIALGLSIPISQNGGTISDDVLDEAVAYVAGYPYKMQMLGHHLWNVSRSADHRVLREHLEAAKRSVDKELDKHIYGTIWKLVSVPSRHFVRALLEHGGVSTVQDIQKRLRMSMSDVERCRDELASHGLAEHDNGDWVEITDAIPSHVLAGYLERQDPSRRDRVPLIQPTAHAFTTEHAISSIVPLTPGKPAAPGQADVVQCGLWMPRSRANCVLENGHKGRCRSK